MRGRVFIGGMLVLLCAALLSFFASSAQEPPRPEFGSSLKTLKWDEKKRAAVETESEKKQKAAADDILRVETTLAVFDILVLDKQGNSITGLAKDDFLVKEDGKPQEVASFSLGDGSAVPRSIVLIIDYSGSQLPYIENSVAAAKTLVDKLKPKDRMAIVTDDVALLVDFTSDKAKLKDALEVLAKPGHLGRSEQYSALLATLRELVGDEQRPIIILQTDGDQLGNLRGGSNVTSIGKLPPAIRERFKEYSLEDIYAAAEKSRTTIYTVMPGFRLIDVPAEERIKRAKLTMEKQRQTFSQITPPPSELSERSEAFYRIYAEGILRRQLALANLAKLTGGWADYLEEPGQAAGVYGRIFSGIERRYILSYYPTNDRRDGALRKVEIKVRNHSEYTVWGKKSYYARSQ